MGRKRVLGVLAGTDIRAEITARWAGSADAVIAADGAANRLLASGIPPTVIVGDLDSLDPLIERSDTRVEEDLDQETTDCDKLLLYVQRQYSEAQFSLIGIEGDRFDHVLASLQSTARLYPTARLILRDGFGWFVTPESEVSVSAEIGQTVSLIPLLPCEGVAMQGVRWSPKANLSPNGATSISNLAAARMVIAELKSGLALLIQQVDTGQPTWE
jgi:thiamine pyrophosphokinase